MDSDKTYNGWRNYETWCVNLWLDNDRGSYDYWREQAKECILEVAEGKGNKYIEDPIKRAEIMLGERLKDNFENESCDLLESCRQSASVWSDLLGAALGEVDWYEIASHMLED